MHTGRFKGFTLVELIATLIIVALIAAVGIPRFFDLNVFQESGFYEETLSAVRYAQKHAVATGCTVRVQITATGFSLLRHAGTDASVCNTAPYDTAIADPSNNAATFARTAPGNVILSPQDFTFSADGSASASVTVNVGGRSLQVISATGFVQRL